MVFLLLDLVLAVVGVPPRIAHARAELAVAFGLPADSRSTYVAHGLSVSREMARRVINDVTTGGTPKGLADFSVSLLAVVGEREPQSVRDSLHAIRDVAPRAEVRLVPEMHHIWNVEDVDLFNETMRGCSTGRCTRCCFRHERAPRGPLRQPGGGGRRGHRPHGRVRTRPQLNRKPVSLVRVGLFGGASMDAEHMQIGRVAERTGLSLRTIRYYGEVGLAEPSARSRGGFRLYTESDVDRLLLIKQMKPLDFSLEETRELLSILDRLAGGDLTERDRAALNARLDIFDEAIAARCAALREQLTRAVEFQDLLCAQRDRRGVRT